MNPTNIVLQANQLVNLLCLLAGVRNDVLQRVPGSRGQAATLGFLLLLTPSLSGITMSYAIFRIFGGDFLGLPAAFSGGLLWMAIIFGIERSLLLSIDKTKGWKQIAGQVGIRIPLAFVIGVTVSQPLLLRISRTVLDRELRDRERHDLNSEFDENARRTMLPERMRTVADLESAQHTLQQRLQGEPDSQEYLDAKNAAERAEKTHDAILRRNNQQIARLEAELGRIGVSPQQDNSQADRVAELRQTIAQYRREIFQAAGELRTAKDHQEAVKHDWRQSVEAEVADITARLTPARTNQDTARTAADNLNRQSQEQLNSLMRPNLVNEYTVLKRIENNPSHSDAKTLRYFEYQLAFLFFVLEITPIGIKALGRRTPLDGATIAAEAEDEERALNASNLAIARIQKAAEIAAAVNQKALEMWRDACLERIESQPTITIEDLRDIQQETKAVAASAAY